MSQHVSRSILIAGLPAVGKSTVGRRLAARLDLELVDLDAEIERETGTSPASWILREGESEFRDVERRVLADRIAALAASSAPVVLSLGGGALVDPKNRDLCKDLVAIWLDASDRVIVWRTSEGSVDRPLLSGRSTNGASAERAERVASLRRQREPLFAQFCEIRIENEAEPDDAVDAIVDHLASRES